MSKANWEIVVHGDMLENIPINDSDTHEGKSTCKCNPLVDVVNDIPIVTHNSFDGREAVEEAYRILNGEDDD